MKRLYDQIIEYGLHEAPDHIIEVIRHPETVMVDVSNVAQYIQETYHADNHDKSWTAADFPNIAPPWEVSFFEWIPDFVEFRGVVERSGAVVVGLDYDSHPPKVFAGREGELFDTRPRWIVTCNFVMQLKRMVPHYMGGCALLADQYGKVCTYKDGGDTPVLGSHGPVYEQSGVEGGIEQVVAPALLGISFMHCKNVSAELHDHPEKVQRKRIKKGKKPLKSYYTLGIDPMKEALNREGSAAKSGIKHALHICRGHFATYSPDKPLFGKYSGTFWKPQHVRGNKKHGEVVKDYSVKAPK